MEWLHWDYVELQVPYNGVSGADMQEKGPVQNTWSFVIPPPI